MIEEPISFRDYMDRYYYVLPNGRAIRTDGGLRIMESRPKIITENKQRKQQCAEVFMTQDEVDTKYQWMGAFMVMFGALYKGYGKIAYSLEREFLTPDQRQRMTHDTIGSIMTEADTRYNKSLIFGQKTVILSQDLCIGLIPTTIASGLRSPELKVQTMYPLKNLRKRKKMLVRIYAEKDRARGYGSCLSRDRLMKIASLFGKEYDSAEWYLTKDKSMRPVVGVMDNIDLSIVLAPYVVKE